MEYEQSNIEGNRNKDKPKICISESGTYKKLLRLIVEDAMSSLPTDVYEVFSGDYGIFINLKEKLIEMRQKGTVYLAYDRYNNRFYKNVILQQISQNNYKFLVNNQEVDLKNILFIGDLENPQSCKFHLSIAEQIDIIVYENMLDELDDDYRFSYKDIVKIKDFDEVNDDIEKKKRFNFTMKNLLKRKKNHILAIDSEDNIESVKRDIQDIRWLLEERKSKICLNHSTPYSRLFGDTASGLNATGEGDRRNWNLSIRYFQLQYIYPVLLAFSKMIGKEEEFKALEIEPIEAPDKLLEMQIREIELNISTDAYLSGAIDKQELRFIVERNLGLESLKLKSKNLKNVNIISNN